jgi:hypothetical protein
MPPVLGTKPAHDDDELIGRKKFRPINVVGGLPVCALEFGTLPDGEGGAETDRPLSGGAVMSSCRPGSVGRLNNRGARTSLGRALSGAALSRPLAPAGLAQAGDTDGFIEECRSPTCDSNTIA